MIGKGSHFATSGDRLGIDEPRVWIEHQQFFIGGGGHPDAGEVGNAAGVVIDAEGGSNLGLRDPISINDGTSQDRDGLGTGQHIVGAKGAIGESSNEARRCCCANGGSGPTRQLVIEPRGRNIGIQLKGIGNNSRKLSTGQLIIGAEGAIREAADHILFVEALDILASPVGLNITKLCPTGACG